MEQRHRDIIRSNYCELTKDIKTAVDDVCASLYQARIITDRMRENILEGNSTPTKKAEALLDLIVNRGPSAFEIFYTAILKSELYSAADILNPIMAPHITLGAAPPQAVSSDSPARRENEAATNADGPTGNVLPPQPTSSASSQNTSDADISRRWPSVGLLKKEEIVVQNVQPDSQMHKDYLKSLTPLGQRDYYTMQHVARGRVLIVNNEHFHQVNINARQGEVVKCLSEREGSAFDRDNLETLFQQLGYQVIIYNDQTKENMERIFQEECDRDHSRFDSFILIILSHGHKGVVFGSDGCYIKKSKNECVNYNCIKVKGIKNMFCGITSLRGKPKLFIIQACRGGTIDEGVEVNTTSSSAESGDQDMDVDIQDARDTLAELDEREESDGPRDRIPTETDYLLALSTVSGMVSWRNAGKGSWFIQALVYTFCKNAHLYDLQRLMTMTNSLVCDAETICGKKQGAEKRDTLRKLFCFFPGLHAEYPLPSSQS
ncbi:hypothetical protein BsWGS_07206 [Bradybaena similaris]